MTPIVLLLTDTAVFLASIATAFYAWRAYRSARVHADIAAAHAHEAREAADEARQAATEARAAADECQRLLTMARAA